VPGLRRGKQELAAGTLTPLIMLRIQVPQANRTAPTGAGSPRSRSACRSSRGRASRPPRSRRLSVTPGLSCAAPIVGGMITSTINVLILVPVFFVMMKARALRQGKLQIPEEADA
jgi:hypothetical protein